MDCLDDAEVVRIHRKDYQRYICPYCKRVILTVKLGAHYKDKFGKMKSHVQSCKRYQAAIAKGRARRDSIRYRIVTYSVR